MDYLVISKNKLHNTHKSLTNVNYFILLVATLLIKQIIRTKMDQIKLSFFCQASVGLDQKTEFCCSS